MPGVEDPKWWHFSGVSQGLRGWGSSCMVLGTNMVLRSRASNFSV
jgi:hypothetical protein